MTQGDTGNAPSRRSRPRDRHGIEHDDAGLPTLLYGQASPLSVGGTSMFDMGAVTSDDVTAVMSEGDIVVRAARMLQEAGFTVLQVSPTTINIAGPASLYSEAFDCTLLAEEREVVKEYGRRDSAHFVECRDTDLPGLISTRGTPFAQVLEGVAIEEPRFFMANPFPPSVGYWHLDVPGDVSLGCNADQAHRAGTTGAGVRVVMTDSGHYAHPFFAARGYRVNPVVLGPGARNPADDENGHGTAESANIFALAPDVDFTMVKMNFVNSIGAFNAAVGLAPHVLSNSWGSSKQNPPLSAADNALAASVAAAVASGIVVVFSAGNGHFGFPGQHPDVISAGGVHMDENGRLTPSTYASGFASAIYPGRNVPDLSGLVGHLPRAAYIVLPVQPGDEIDRDLANDRPHPEGDETAPDDGWAAISGTSAAAPQLAGAAALVRQVAPDLDPAAVREVLMASARDVTEGRGFPQPGMGHPATVGPDLATGHGLVDATSAVLLARQRTGSGARSSVRVTADMAGCGFDETCVAELEQIIAESGGLPG